MSDTYLIPQFIIDYLQKSRSTKSPQKIVGTLLKKYKTPEIEQWFRENEVTVRYLWKFFVFYGLNKFSFRECPECGKRLKLTTILRKPDAKYCSTKCMTNSEEIKNKVKASNIKKFGVEYPLQSKEMQEKHKRTCLEKYGVDSFSKTKEFKEKRKETFLERYGVEQTFQLKAFRDKSKQTCLKRYGVDTYVKTDEYKERVKHTNLEKYGVENVAQSKEIQKKIKQTNLKKYGVENPSQLKENREKAKQTCLEKYGVGYFSQTEEFKEKFKQTSLERYGVEHPFQTLEAQEKQKETCLEKYGVYNPFQSNEIKLKIKETNLEKYGVEHFSQSKEFKEQHRSEFWETFCNNLKEKDIVPMFSKEEYINDTGRKFKCLVCGEEFVSDGAIESENSECCTLSTYRIHCPHCFKAPTSKKEKEVLEFVKSNYNSEILENHKGLFPNKQMELDIYLPNLNLGIEFDGDYWHSLEDAKERDERKNKLCEEKGIKLIRIKESEWDNNRKAVEKQILEVIESLK